MKKWNQKLTARFEDRVLSTVSRKLGFSKNRMHVIVKEGQCPNAIDAVKICRYINATVEDIFGDDATAELKTAPTREAADQAAQKALDMTTAELQGVIDAANREVKRRVSTKETDKSRKSG